MLTNVSMHPRAVHAAFLPLSDRECVGEALARAGLEHVDGSVQCVSLQFKAYRRAQSWLRAGARVCYRVRATPRGDSRNSAGEIILHGWARWSCATGPLHMDAPPLRALLGALTLDLWPVPQDDTLPGLCPLWTLPHGHSAMTPSMVSYRPGVRALLRYAPYDDTPETWAKTFASNEQAQQVHARSRHIHAACDGTFQTPPPLGLDLAHSAVWHLGVPGTPLMSTLHTGFDSALTSRLGQALACLHAIPHQDLPRLRIDAQHTDALKKIDRLRTVRTELSDDLEALRIGIEEDPAQPGPSRDVALHGDFHLRQWLGDGDHLTLCDFDEVCLGAPEVDVASLLMDLSLYQMTPATVTDWTVSFVHAYAARAPRGLNHRMLLWQLRVQAVNKMHRAWAQLHPDLTWQCRHFLSHLDHLLSTPLP